MKQLFVALFICALILGCQKRKGNTDLGPKSTNETQDSLVNDPIEQSNEPLKVIPKVPLGFLVTYEGKYATQEKIFNNIELADRLKRLERFNYDALLQNYNTETPITIVDNIVHMSGCKQHDCPSNAYDFFIDLTNDNINVYYFRNNMLRVYQEKGWIDLPSTFNAEMEIKKENAGIGDPDRIESNYSLE